MQLNGGGFNSSLTVPAVNAAHPLDPGESIAVQIAMGVQQAGTFHLCLHTESRPVATGGLIDLAGVTDGPQPHEETGCAAPAYPAETTPQSDQPDVAPSGDGTTPAPPLTQMPTPPPTGTAADTTAPVLRSLALARSRFSRRASTRVSFSLSEPARVVIGIERRRPGKRPRFLRLPRTLATNGVAGKNTVRLKGSGLAKGRHRLVAVATDAAGNPSRPAIKRFRIVLKRR